MPWAAGKTGADPRVGAAFEGSREMAWGGHSSPPIIADTPLSPSLLVSALLGIPPTCKVFCQNQGIHVRLE